ncbi:MAG TPA: hypothetical protein VIG44_10685 [Thermomicrobiales bacterium]
MVVQLYVGTERGLFTLREARRDWQQTHTTLERRRIVALDYNRSSPSLLYIAADNEGIYSSSDAGNSAIFRVGGDAHCVHVRRDAPKTIYAGMDRAMVWASGDGGDHWERLDTFRELWGDPEAVARQPRPRGIVRTVIGVPEEKYGILAGLDPEGLAFSLDDGHIWNYVESSPPGIRALAVNPANRASLYAATDSGIWRSINGGNDWIESNIDLPAGAVTWVSATADDLFTCVGDTLYRAPQGVPIWRPIATAPTARMTAIAIDDTDRRLSGNLYYGTHEGTIIRSTDGGTTWAEIAHGLPPIHCVIVTQE